MSQSMIDDAVDAAAQDRRSGEGRRLDDSDDNPTTWISHPINIRISVPLLHRRFYLTVVAGEERRRHERRKAEREDHPLLTAGNVFFSLGVATLFTIMALGVLIAQSAIIE